MDKNTIKGEALYRALHRSQLNLRYGRTRWDWVDICAIASIIIIVATWTMIGLKSCEHEEEYNCPPAAAYGY